jgi:tetraacyldisaccharide-1-P 4'-kinase
MATRWSVQDAKARLSEVLARARAGEPQRIGLDKSCVVVSEESWGGKGKTSLGAWLADSAPRGTPLREASRKSKRGDPFAPKKARPRKKTAKK